MGRNERHGRLLLAAAVPLAATGLTAAPDEPPGVAVAAKLVEARKVGWDQVVDRCSGSRPTRRSAAGYLVTLSLDGEIHQFFVNGEQALMCGSKGAPAVADGIADLGLRALAEAARKDLAARLRVPVEEIRVRDAERVIWRDSSIGCPRPGRVYAQAMTEGARVFLLVGERVYRYHQAGGAPPSLCETPAGLEPLPAHELK